MSGGQIAGLVIGIIVVLGVAVSMGAAIGQSMIE
jgi:hypothetical protein